MNQASCIQVRVPATSANLGPGFDCLGLALDLWNEISFRPEGDGLVMRASPTGSWEVANERNMVIQAMRFFCDERGVSLPRGVKIDCRYDVPMGSGLGSSATAALLGILGAAALTGSPLESSEALALSARMEGHADNAAAALLGGLVIVAGSKGGWIVRRIEIAPLRVAVVLPDVNLPTHAARAALPSEVSLADATFTLGRAMLVVEALRSGDLALLRQAMDDRLHLPYRLPLIPGGQRALDAAYGAGASAVTISGAGPSLIAFSAGDPAPIAAAMVNAFAAHNTPARTYLLKTSPSGAQVAVR